MKYVHHSRSKAQSVNRFRLPTNEKQRVEDIFRAVFVFPKSSYILWAWRPHTTTEAARFSRVELQIFSLYSLALAAAAAVVRWESVGSEKKRLTQYATTTFLLRRFFHHWTDTNARRQQKYYQTTISSDTSRIVGHIYIYIWSILVCVCMYTVHIGNYWVSYIERKSFLSICHCWT